MFDRFQGQKRMIVSGVKIPLGESKLVESTLALAQKTAMKVRFVHAVEPLASISPIYPNYVKAHLQRLMADEKMEQTVAGFEQSMKPYLSKADFTTGIAVGQPGKALLSDALTHRASLIVCGVNLLTHHLVPKGFATAQELVAHSPLPVLVLPEGKALDFSRKPMTALVLDDLTDASADAVSTACEFLGALEDAAFIHAHIHPESEEQMVSWAERVADITKARGIELKLDMDLSKGSILAETDKAIRKHLSDRLGVSPSLLTQHRVRCEQKVAFGDVAAHIEGMVMDMKPDLLVFGRHQFWHHQPLSMGQVPFQVMVGFGIPTLVVASQGHLISA